MHEGARRDPAMSYVQPTRKVYPAPYPHECPQVIPARYTLDTCNLGLAPRHQRGRIRWWVRIGARTHH